MYIRQWIEDALASPTLSAEILQDDYARNLLDAIAAKFSKPLDATDYIWDGFVDFRSVHTPEGWRVACSYDFPSSPILLAHDAGSMLGYRFSSGDALLKLLEECPGFEFYLTDHMSSFALVFNHHDILLAVGEAKDWLHRLICDGAFIEKRADI